MVLAHVSSFGVFLHTTCVTARIGKPSPTVGYNPKLTDKFTNLTLLLE